MGKVISTFSRGWAGAVSRSKDDVIISLKNADSAPIPFGAPVFIRVNDQGGINFNAETTGYDTFVGFAVRVADKTPPTQQAFSGQYEPGDIVEVLTRGSITLPIATSYSRAGDKLYIRKADAKLTITPGSEGTSIQIENAVLRGTRDAAGFSEVTLLERRM